MPSRKYQPESSKDFEKNRWKNCETANPHSGKLEFTVEGNAKVKCDKKIHMWMPRAKPAQIEYDLCFKLPDDAQPQCV